MGQRAGAGAHQGPVRLLDVDPDLFDAVDRSQAESATRASLVHTVVLSEGPWRDADEFAGAMLYVIGGALVGRASVGGHCGVELLGPGRLLSVEDHADGGLERFPLAMTWGALEPTWLALLDREFWHALSAYPSVTVALLDRALLRADDLNARLAIAGLESLEDRVMALLGFLSETHGRVGREGTVVDLPLSTTLLSQLLPPRPASTPAPPPAAQVGAAHSD